jgi:hypothetical protein
LNRHLLRKYLLFNSKPQFLDLDDLSDDKLCSIYIIYNFS